jgi:hypothetical protein
MPSYKTHAIHGDILFPHMDKKVDINKEDLKVFCMGPDLIGAINPSLFRTQHSSKTREFFITLLKEIKDNNLQDNEEVMAFLYGQLEHFVLDLVVHPLVYYMTEGLPNDHIVTGHGLVEHLIDDYVINQYGLSKGSFRKLGMVNDKTYDVINNTYEKVYNCFNVWVQYSAGIITLKLYDSVVRKDKTSIISTITDLINLGDVKYHDEKELAVPYLNLEHNTWFNPETGVAYNLSFDDLWLRASELYLDLIYDVNNYLYLDKPFNNQLVMNNTSYLTGLPCEFGQSKKYVKSYKKD